MAQSKQNFWSEPPNILASLAHPPLWKWTIDLHWRQKVEQVWLLERRKALPSSGATWAVQITFEQERGSSKIRCQAGKSQAQPGREPRDLQGRLFLSEYADSSTVIAAPWEVGPRFWIKPYQVRPGADGVRDHLKLWDPRQPAPPRRRKETRQRLWFLLQQEYEQHAGRERLFR